MSKQTKPLLFKNIQCFTQ